MGEQVSLHRRFRLVLVERRLVCGLVVLVLAGAAVTVADGQRGANASGAAGARTYGYDSSGVLRAYVDRCCPGRWAAYDPGGGFTGRIKRSKRHRGVLNVYTGQGETRVAYAERRYEGRWNVYEVGRVYRGYVEWINGHRWRVYGWNSVAKIHVREGYAQGSDGVVGGVALLLLVSWRDPG